MYKNLKILLVDDDLTFLEAATDFFNKLNIRTETAATSEHALIKFKVFSPHLTFSELNMKKAGEGRELLISFLIQSPGARIILYSRQNQDKIDLLTLGAEDFFNKLEFFTYINNLLQDIR